MKKVSILIVALAVISIGGYALSTNAAVDVCPNLSGTQTQVPENHQLDVNGNCVGTGGGLLPCVYDGTCPCFGVNDIEEGYTASCGIATGKLVPVEPYGYIPAEQVSETEVQKTLIGMLQELITLLQLKLSR